MEDYGLLAFCSSSEFIPYVFQIMSMMLEIHDDCPQPYVELFPFLLNHVLWERHGNIPALTRLVQAFIEKGSNSIIAQEKLVSAKKKMEYFTSQEFESRRKVQEISRWQ